MPGLLEKFLIGAITGGVWGLLLCLYENWKAKPARQAEMLAAAKASLEDDPANPPKTAQETWERLNDKAGYYYKAKDYAQGIEVATQALSFSETNFGANHENTAATLNNLALLYQAQQNFTEAEKFLRKAVEVYEVAVGRKHEKTLTALKNLYELAAAQAKAKR